MRGRVDEYATHVRQHVRDTTGNLEAVQQGPSLEEEKHEAMMRMQSTYWRTVVTKTIAGIGIVETKTERYVDGAIEAALLALEDEYDCKMTIVQCDKTPVLTYGNDGDVTVFVITVFVRPLPGEVPQRGPRRSYYRQR